jgi:hypothetical protein
MVTLSFHPNLIILVLIIVAIIWAVYTIKHGCIEADGGKTILAFMVIVFCIGLIIGLGLGHYLGRIGL